MNLSTMRKNKYHWAKIKYVNKVESYWKVKVVRAQTHMPLHGETSFRVDDLEQCFVSLFFILGHERENIQHQPVIISPFVTSRRHTPYMWVDVARRVKCGSGSVGDSTLTVLFDDLDLVFRCEEYASDEASCEWILIALLLNESRWMLNNCNIYLIKYKFRWQHAQWPPTETGSTWWSRKTHWADSAVNACNCRRAARTSSSTPSVCESSNVSRTFGRPMWHRPTTPESQSAETWG